MITFLILDQNFPKFAKTFRSVGLDKLGCVTVGTNQSKCC